MALPAAGGDYPPIRDSGGPSYPPKRRTNDAVDDDHDFHSQINLKRPRHVRYRHFADHVAFKAADEPLLSRHPLYYPTPQYGYPHPHPYSPCSELVGAVAPAMERTASGHSICPEPVERCGSTELLEDDEAAQRVCTHFANFRRRNPDSKHERILRSIINPRRRSYRHHRLCDSAGHVPDENDEAEYPLDNDALESIFSAANELFFNGRLSKRVRWDWSHASSARYDTRVIGTTALRRAQPSTRGFETLIVLSSPILRDPRFSRRLLISTFLHELIHCYLFICCGFRARCCGGHTPGFRTIARLIDDWAGPESGLYLSRIEADLDLFRIGTPLRGARKDVGWGPVPEMRDEKAYLPAAHVYPCSEMATERELAPGTTTAAVVTGSRHDVQEDAEYFGAAASPSSPGPGTVNQDIVHYQHNRRGATSNAWWWRQHRPIRPLYVHSSGTSTTAPYVYPNTVLQRP